MVLGVDGDSLIILLLISVFLISVSGCPTLEWHHSGQQKPAHAETVIELHNLEAHHTTHQDEVGGSAFPWSVSLAPSIETLLPPSAGDTAPLSPAAVTDFSAQPLWGGGLLAADVTIVLRWSEASLCTTK